MSTCIIQKVLCTPNMCLDSRCRAQGEVIEQQFGEKELCFRTLDLYTSAVLEASLNPTTPPKPEWRGAMNLMSQVTLPVSPCQSGRAAYGIANVPSISTWLDYILGAQPACVCSLPPIYCNPCCMLIVHSM